MQIQSFGLFPIQFVSDDGTIQAKRMSGMYTELVSTAGTWIEGNTGLFVSALQDLEVCNGRLAVLCMYHLPGAVKRVQTKRKLNGSAVCSHCPVKQSDITLVDEAVLELSLQIPMYILVLAINNKPEVAMSSR